MLSIWLLLVAVAVARLELVGHHLAEVVEEEFLNPRSLDCQRLPTRLQLVEEALVKQVEGHPGLTVALAQTALLLARV